MSFSFPCDCLCCCRAGATSWTPGILYFLHCDRGLEAGLLYWQGGEQAGRSTDLSAREDRSPPLDALMTTTPVGGWFANVSWDCVPNDMAGDLVPTGSKRPAPKLLGGSSKLAKLAEERRRKAEAAKQGSSVDAETKKATSALDRLTLDKTGEQGGSQQAAPTPEPRKYPARKKREPTPPPAEPEPESEPEKEQLPDLRAPPTAFGRAISTCPHTGALSTFMTVSDMLGSTTAPDAFQNPSPDDVVSHAQGGSKGLNK